MNVLDKNDSPPVFPGGPVVLRVSEELGAGQAVGSVRAKDPDSLGRLRYELRAPPEASEKFALEPDSGLLKLVEPLDREVHDSYKLVVRASDGIQYTDTTITIQV